MSGIPEIEIIGGAFQKIKANTRPEKLKETVDLISVIMNEYQVRFEKTVKQLNALKQTANELSKLVDDISKRAKRYPSGKGAEAHRILF